MFVGQLLSVLKLKNKLAALMRVTVLLVFLKVNSILKMIVSSNFSSFWNIPLFVRAFSTSLPSFTFAFFFQLPIFYSRLLKYLCAQMKGKKSH